MRCVIVEDEFPARQELKYFVEEDSRMDCIADFGDSLDALSYCQEHLESIDVVFLDIHMPGLDGMNLAKVLKKMKPDLAIVFVTAYPDYAVAAFEIQAEDYLLKPFSEERIAQVFERLSKDAPGPSLEQVSVYHGDTIVILNVEDISVVEADKRETKVYSQGKIYSSRRKISDWEEVLDPKSFYRCHRSFLIQLEKLQEIETWSPTSFLLHVKDCPLGIPLSRNRVKEFKGIFHIK